MNPALPKIAAVFATMNRGHVAVACVKGRANQPALESDRRRQPLQ